MLRLITKRINYESNHSFKSVRHIFLTTESLILAQDERWRCASYMQVEREEEACFFGKWRTGEYNIGNLPLGGGQQRETSANTPYERS